MCPGPQNLPLHSLLVLVLYLAPKKNRSNVPAGVYTGDHVLMIAFPGPSPAATRRNSHLHPQFLPPAPSKFHHQRRDSGYASWQGGLEAASIHPLTSSPRSPPTEIAFPPVSLQQLAHTFMTTPKRDSPQNVFCPVRTTLPSFLYTASASGTHYAERPNPVPVCKGLWADSLILARPLINVLCSKSNILRVTDKRH